MTDKLLLTYSDIDEDKFIIRGGYQCFDFKLEYLGFILRESESLFELTFYLNIDSNFEVIKTFKKNYVLKQFGNLDYFLSTELEKIIKEIEEKLDKRINK